MLNLNNGQEYFGEEFVKQFENILQHCENDNNFLFIHGTSTKETAEDICYNGLISDFPELCYTSELIEKNDVLLYEKLKSWPHWNYKFLVLCIVPKSSGKGGTPIWKTTAENIINILPPEFIKGYINVEKKIIAQNKLYSQIHNYKDMIEDRSYLPITGEKLQISIPPDEEEFYNELLNFDK